MRRVDKTLTNSGKFPLSKGGKVFLFSSPFPFGKGEEGEEEDLSLSSLGRGGKPLYFKHSSLSQEKKEKNKRRRKNKFFPFSPPFFFLFRRRGEKILRFSSKKYYRRKLFQFSSIFPLKGEGEEEKKEKKKSFPFPFSFPLSFLFRRSFFHFFLSLFLS